MKKTSKFLAFLLSIIMVLSVAPVVGFAETTVEDITVKVPLLQTVHLSKDVTSTERMFFNTKDLGVTGDHVAEFQDSRTGNYGDLGPMMTFELPDTDNLKSAKLKIYAARYSSEKTGYVGTMIDANTSISLRQYSFADMRIQENTSPSGASLTTYDSTVRTTYANFYQAMTGFKKTDGSYVDKQVVIRSNEILQYGNWNNSETYLMSINLDDVSLAENSYFTIVIGSSADTYYSAEKAEKLPYIEMVYDGAAVLAELNAAESKSATLAFLNSWGEAIGIDMTAYNALSAPLQDKVLGQLTGKDYASFGAFKTAFDTAVTQAATITDTVTVKVPIVQTVHYLRDAKDGAEDNVSTVTFNLKNYGVAGDRVVALNDGANYYNHSASEGPLMNFEIGETENLKSATFKIKAARHSADSTGAVGTSKLSVIKYSTVNMPVYEGTTPGGESASIIESCAEGSYGTYYDYRINKMTAITAIRSSEYLQYGNRNNSESYWMSIDLLTDNRITLAANSDLTIMTNITSWDDYYSAEKAENLPYIEMVYDAIPMVYAVNQAADAAAMQTALGAVAGFEFDTLSASQKSAVAAAIVSARPAAGYENYAELKAEYVEALAGKNSVVINRVKFDGDSISEICYLANGLNSGAKIVLAAYNEKQLVKAVFADALTVGASESPARKVRISAMSGLTGADEIKVFIWNGLSELVPLAECFAKDSFASGANYYYSDGSYASVN